MLIPKAIRGFLPFAIAVSIAHAATVWISTPFLDRWYPLVTKPRWAMPAAAFSPVWGVVYAFMAIAAWRLQQAEGWEKAHGPLYLWGLQLVLSVFWAGFFFALRNILWATIESLILLAVIVTTLASFWRLRRDSIRWLAPCALWGVYTVALSLSVWQMTR